jgi:hypothetical protein
MFIKSDDGILINSDYIVKAFIKKQGDLWNILLYLKVSECLFFYKSFNSEYDAQENLDDLYRILP